MKKKNLMYKALVASLDIALVGTTFVSCSDDDEPEEPATQQTDNNNQGGNNNRGNENQTTLNVKFVAPDITKLFTESRHRKIFQIQHLFEGGSFFFRTPIATTMKKALKNLLAAAITLTTVLCGITNTALAQTQMTEESLMKLVKTPKGQTIKLDEYKAVFLKYADTEIENTLEIAWNNPVSKALDKISSDYKLPDLKDFYLSLLTNKSPQVKGKAIEKLKTWRLEDDVVNKITNVIQNDTSCFVIVSGLRSIGFHYEKYENLANFMRSLENHPNEIVRIALASALSSYGNRNTESAKEILHRLINDKARGVRQVVLTNIGSFHDESFIDDLEKVLNDQSETFLHSQAFSSLFKLWYDNSSTSKRAHDICFKYLSQKPRTRETPDWLAVSYLNFENPTKYGYGRNEWKTKATYFSESEWVNLLIDIITDKQAYSFARDNAVEKLGILGTKADLENAKAKVEALTDDNEHDSILSKIDKEISKIQ